MQNGQIPLPLLTCYRCGTSWRQRKEETPKKCPKCQSYLWRLPHPTADKLLGPAPHKLGDLADKQVLIMPRTIPELHSLNVDIMDCANWLQEGLDQAQTQLRRVQGHSRRSLDILERLVSATQPTQLPPAVAEGTTQPPSGANPAEAPKSPPDAKPAAAIRPPTTRPGEARAGDAPRRRRASKHPQRIREVERAKK